MDRSSGGWWRAGAMLVLLGAGCTTSNPFTWNWQSNNAKPEEYHVPQMSDTRYEEPQRFPKYLVTPGLKKPDSDLDRPRPPAFGAAPSAAGGMY